LSQEDIARSLDVSLEDYILYELGQKDFSFSFLYNAANILGVDVHDLIGGDSPKLSRFAIVRKGKGYDISRRKAYDYKHLAFTFRDKKGEPFLVTIEPGAAASEPEKHSHKGQEFNYVLFGSIKIYFEDEIYELTEGDSVYFDSAIPHAMRAVGDQSAMFLAIVMK
jgi:quercetin dioxygenase-like cupin family protein